MINATPANIRRNARECHVQAVKAAIDIDDAGEFKEVKATVVAKDGKRYLTFKMYARPGSEIAKSGRIAKRSRTWVHCSCPYFRYYLEVALAARGSSSILSSTGAYPKIRNPNMRPYLCKHLFAASRDANTIKARRRKVTTIDEMELDQLVTLLRDHIPGA